MFAKSILADRYLASRWFLRTLIAAEIGATSEKIRFSYNEFGKPHLEQYRSDEIHFNISHCEDILVVAICHGTPVGIDVESFRRLPDEESIVKQFFHIGEQSEYFRLPEPLRPQAFLNGWTRKEAVIKALGTGLNTPLDSFQVSLDPRQPAKLIDPPKIESMTTAEEWSLHSYELILGTSTAVAAPHPSSRIAIEHKNAVDLFHATETKHHEKVSNSQLH